MKINEIYPANKELTPEEIWLLTSDSSAVPIKKTVEVDTIEIDTAGIFNSLKNSLFGDFVEDDTLGVVGFKSEHLI